jgi:hypothetical protein
MNTWSYINLGDATLAGPALERLLHPLRSAFEDAGPGAGIAVFTRHESEGRLHCDLLVYFSPAASTLARSLGARTCARPAPGDLDLAVGSPGVRDRLFDDA